MVEADLAGKRYVYLWADGVYFNVRLADEGEGRQCVLVVMGATEDGTQGAGGDPRRPPRERAVWLELLRDLQDRGLEGDPQLAVGDGALGFWKALPQVFPDDPAAAVLGAQDVPTC